MMLCPWWSTRYSSLHKWVWPKCHYVTEVIAVFQVDPDVTAQNAGQLVPVATSLFLKYAHGMYVQ